MNTDALHAFYNFNPRPVDAWIFENDAVWRAIEAQICAFPSYVLPSADKPCAIVGICHNGLGVGEVWMVTGVGFERQCIVIKDQLVDLCNKAIEFFNLHRLHMAIDVNRNDAVKFAERVGFRFGGRQERLGARGNDVNYYIYERNA